jgi:hypothetical protein
MKRSSSEQCSRRPEATALVQQEARNRNRNRNRNRTKTEKHVPRGNISEWAPRYAEKKEVVPDNVGNKVD